MKYLILFLVLSSCTHNSTVQPEKEPQTVKVLKTVYYNGVNDDLLTAGLGLKGLRGAAPQLTSEPTAAELRRASYYQQFKALNDLSDAGGYGRLYGLRSNQEPIAGTEYWSQRMVVDGVYHTVVLQVPDTLTGEEKCLVVAPSSGSRNVLGAVGTSGSWALTHGCAVVYTDKGSGTQVALDDNKGYQIDGLLVSPAMAASDTMMEGTKLLASEGFHVVQKHAYSQVNPEQYWGEFVLDAVEYALAVLQQNNQLNKTQIKVIAASVSNGGGAVLRAAEKDSKGLIDAVVAAEPQVNLQHLYQLKTAKQITEISTKPLLELSMNLSLLEPCASLHDSLNTAPFKMNTALLQPLLKARCAALVERGMIEGNDVVQQVHSAQQKIKQMGITDEALKLAHINTLANLWGSINHTYANSYLKQSVHDNLCHSAMSAFTASGQPRKLSEAELTGMFALSNGIAPSNGIELAVTDTENKVQSKMMLAPAMGIDTQWCFYQLLNTPDLQDAMATIATNPEDNQVPTLILHGQADGTVAINHASRAYYHRNQSSESANSMMRYYEIEHVQHFDAFLPYPGFNQQFVPMHPYFEQALDLMYQHVFSNKVLPASQLVKTTTRKLNQEENKLEDLEVHNTPIISLQPNHKILTDGKTLEIK